MAFAAEQDAHPFDTHLQAFLVDLNGDGKPDAVAQKTGKGVQLAQIGGGGGSMLGPVMKALGIGAAGYGAYRATQGAAPVAEQPVATEQAAAPRSQGTFVDQLMRPRPSDYAPQRRPQGGVLDMINAPTPVQTPDRPQNILMQGLDKAGQAASLVDYMALGIPSSVAGLVNAAIPGQPLGGMREAQQSSANARSDLSSTSLGRDLLALPEAFAGSGPGTVAGGMPGRGPKSSPYEPYYRRHEIETGIRDKVMDAPQALTYDPASTRQFREGQVVEGAQQRAAQQGADNASRTAIDTREAARAQREAPLRQRQDETQRIDDILSQLPKDGVKGDMLGFIEQASTQAQVEPWKVLRAMTDRGYDLSGLTRAAFQAPRKDGKLGRMNDESKALWDMVRHDNDVLYRKRETPYEPQEGNILMGGMRRPGSEN